MRKHVLQSELWEKFKNDYGTYAVRVGDILYTKHKIPFSNYFYGYCPRVNPFDIDFEKLRESMVDNSCIAVHFDVPNIIRGEEGAEEAEKILKDKCVKSQRDEFAKGNFFMDLKKSEEEILANMHKKHRYNIGLAQRKGVTVRESVSDEDFDLFYNLYSETAQRQKFFGRSRTYLSKVWETFREEYSSHLLIAEYEGNPLSAWMVLIYDGVLYYPYGGSTEKDKETQSSCLLGWEAIKFGKKMGCELFDMWGAAEDMSNKSDPYYGFSVFKEKFGATHVSYIDSYDYVVNDTVYKMFITANNIRWKLLGILK
ncbi:peptidoglycan bridge formation glycyltransferase FemA/FemB family protein [Patescibacteria group bacterium]|nr:peptidoglycan bridge formation glycyltransferase FemA/FemB family protein [Patescibacteria group bacterium]